jgi:hypothetical protein
LKHLQLLGGCENVSGGGCWPFLSASTVARTKKDCGGSIPVTGRTQDRNDNCRNTVEAAERAARIGLLFTEAIPAIEQDKQEDKGQLPGKEEATVTE